MNPNVIRNYINTKKGLPIKVIHRGARNKNNYYYGYIKDIYPQIFTISTNGYLKSFSYSDVICKEISIIFL